MTFTQALDGWLTARETLRGLETIPKADTLEAERAVDRAAVMVDLFFDELDDRINEIGRAL